MGDVFVQSVVIWNHDPMWDMSIIEGSAVAAQGDEVVLMVEMVSEAGRNELQVLELLSRNFSNSEPIEKLLHVKEITRETIVGGI